MKGVRPKWARTPAQAAALLERLQALARAMVGLTILTGLRRGEIFAIRWRDIDENRRLLTVREAVYDGVISAPKTEAGSRQIPLSDASVALIGEWGTRTYTGFWQAVQEQERSRVWGGIHCSFEARPAGRCVRGSRSSR